MKIVEAGIASGVLIKMIRYHDRTGLIGSAERTASGYCGHRAYTPERSHTLKCLRRCRGPSEAHETPQNRAN